MSPQIAIVEDHYLNVQIVNKQINLRVVFVEEGN